MSTEKEPSAVAIWLYENKSIVLYAACLLIGLTLTGLASYKSSSMVESEAIGRVDVSPEIENVTYNYLKGYFSKHIDTGGFFSQSIRFELWGFTYGKRFYSIDKDCNTPRAHDEKELYDYVCRRSDDDQNYYVRISQYPNGVKPDTTINYVSESEYY